MRGMPKCRRVSWASDVNLCQVRLFLSEECPLQVGLVAEDNLQAKTSWPSHSTGTGGTCSDDNVPPGFEEAHPANLLKIKLSEIPLIKWICPPSFVLDFTWQVVAGEESEQVEVQNQREMRVLEAVFPRLSAIPSNPSDLMGLDDSPNSDQQTPLIPITPIEEEDSAADTSFDSMAANITQSASGFSSSSQSVSSGDPNAPASGNQSASIVHGIEPDVAAAAYARLATSMTSNNQGNLIDHDFLVKVLRNPKFIEDFVMGHQVATVSQVEPEPEPEPEPRPPPFTFSDPSSSAPFYPPSMAGPVFNPHLPPPEVVVAPPCVSAGGAPVAKDINYYKTLIHQHGGEKQETLPQHGGGRPNQQGVANFDSGNSPKSRDSKPKINKPCIYFNSTRGCRHGANCLYRHDTTSLQRGGSMLPEVQSAKRMKGEREVSGA